MKRFPSWPVGPSIAASGVLSALMVLAVLFVPVSAKAGDDNLSPERITQLADRVALWQLDRLDDFSYLRTFRQETEQTRGWIQATFYIGLSRWHGVTQNTGYLRAIERLADTNGWQIGDRHWHADDQAIAQVYLGLENKVGAGDRSNVQVAFASILKDPPGNSLAFTRGTPDLSEGSCQYRWCWCDALFMAPPAWAALSARTGEARYLDYALSEYAATRTYLYDPEEHLFYRDSRYFEQRSSQGNKIFWSRGNGWVFAGLPLLLEEIPQDHPGRQPLETQFREMAQALKDLQAKSGLWASSLLDVEQSVSPETSGSAFITFGLAWGVNQGLLPREEYQPVIERAWKAITGYVDAAGRLGWVQQVGTGPGQVLATDTQLYGVGAFLLAASELVRRD